MQVMLCACVYDQFRSIFCVGRPSLLTAFEICWQCQTVNEEEIFDVQDKRGLFQLGWIHVIFAAELSFFVLSK